MFRLLPTFAFAVVLVAAAASAAQDAKKEKKAGLSGVWTREAGGFELKFDFTDAKKGTFKAHVASGADGIVATCKFEVRDGAVKAEVTAVEEKGNFQSKPPVGYEFGFKWEPKGGTAELSELKGENVDNIKPVIEGQWTRVKAKKE
jgi:hypothetical protein